MPDAKTSNGGCHCGRVRYEVTCDLAMVMACNCSICAKRGALWAFAKKPQFKLLKGADALSDYQFGQKRIRSSVLRFMRRRIVLRRGCAQWR